MERSSRRAIQLGEDAPQRLGEGGRGVLHARRLADAAAAPRVPEAQPAVGAREPEPQRDKPQQEHEPERQKRRGHLADGAGDAERQPQGEPHVGRREALEAGQRRPDHPHDGGGRQPERRAHQRQRDHAGLHGQRRLVRVLGLRRSRDGEERDPERLDEAGRAEPAREREHGHRDRHDHRDLGLRDRRPAEQGLEHQPFGGEPVERRQRRDRARADEEEEGGARHPLDQPAHLLHVARARRVQHRPRAQEQQPLEARVVDRVIQAADDAQGGERRQPVALEHQARPDPDEDDADVLDRVKGEQPLEIVLHEGVEHPEQRRDGAQAEHEAAPPRGPAREQVDRDAEQAVDAHLDHDAGHQRRHVARRDGMRHRQPHVQRDETGLGAEPEERQHEGRVADRGRQGAPIASPRRSVVRSPADRRRNIATRAAKPACVKAMYQCAARIVPG